MPVLQEEQVGPGRPPLATRFSSVNQPGNAGRTDSRWIRNKLGRAFRDGDRTARDAIADHLIEVATSWEVRVIGRDSDGEMLKVASARDAVEAAKVLFAYDMGLPKKGTNVSPPTNADHNRSTYDLALDTYRERLLSGELSEEELLSVTKLFAEAEKSEAEAVARILGDKSEMSKSLRERVEKLLSRMEARMNAAEAPKVIEAQVAEERPSE
jgi:hypothetical protein